MAQTEELSVFKCATVIERDSARDACHVRSAPVTCKSYYCEAQVVAANCRVLKHLWSCYLWWKLLERNSTRTVYQWLDESGLWKEQF